MMIYIRKAEQRGHSNLGWLDSNFTFSFADYHNPDFMGFSSLRVINEDRVEPQQGFGTHSHKNMEILSYVLEGVIEHKDSMGNKRQVHAGEFQIMSAGSGITHSEYNPDPNKTAHFYQIWVMPNKMNIAPRYEQKMLTQLEPRQLLLSPEENDGGLFKVNQDMRLWRWNLKKHDEETYLIEPERAVWIQVVHGSIKINGQTAKTSDGVAIAKESKIVISADEDSEILLFDLA